MNKLRASYSILDTWAKGRYEDAALYYFKLKSFTTEKMDDGIKLHQKWSQHIQLSNTLPIEFGNAPLKKPQCEVKLECSLGDWLTLVGRLDLYDDGVIYDFKSGVKNSSEYIESMQLPIYGLITKLNDMPTSMGKILHLNQYDMSTDQSWIWLTKESSKKALEWVKLYSSQMHEYFTSEGLYEKFGNREPITEGGEDQDA